jgi:hypothetical protein
MTRRFQFARLCSLKLVNPVIDTEGHRSPKIDAKVSRFVFQPPYEILERYSNRVIWQ